MDKLRKGDFKKETNNIFQHAVKPIRVYIVYESGFPETEHFSFEANGVAGSKYTTEPDAQNILKWTELKWTESKKMIAEQIIKADRLRMSRHLQKGKSRATLAAA
jgi:hypothetical protein